MNRFFVTLGSAAFCLVAGQAAATQDKPHITWIGDWEAAKKEAAARHVPIIAIYEKKRTVAGEDGESVTRDGPLWEEAFSDQKLVAATKGFVMCVGQTGSGWYAHEEVEIGNPPVKKCALYKTITCKEHDEISAWLEKDYFWKSSCRAFAFDEHGKMIRSGINHNTPTSASNLIEFIEDVKKQFGPGLSLSEWETAQADAARAKADIEAGRIRNVSKFLRALARSKIPSLIDQGRELSAQLQAKGNKLVDDALGAAPSNPEDAKATLKSIYLDCAGLDCSARAFAELTKLGGQIPMTEILENVRWESPPLSTSIEGKVPYSRTVEDAKSRKKTKTADVVLEIGDSKIKSVSGWWEDEKGTRYSFNNFRAEDGSSWNGTLTITFKNAAKLSLKFSGGSVSSADGKVVQEGKSVSVEALVTEGKAAAGIQGVVDNAFGVIGEAINVMKEFTHE